MKKEDVIKEYMRELGKKGSKVANAKRTPEERKRLGKLGAIKRWKKEEEK